MAPRLQKAKSLKGVAKDDAKPKAVAPASGLESKGKVLEESGEQMDLELRVSDGSNSKTKFCHIQVVESNDKTQYWFVQQWGPVGTLGQTKVKGPCSKAEALKLMKLKFAEKTGKPWDQRDSVEMEGAEPTADSGELPSYTSAPTVEQARMDIERVAKEGRQQEYESQQFERFKQARQQGGLEGSCMTLHHGPGAPGICSSGLHLWHFWLCHHCSTVQYWPACVNGCDWGTFGWTCVEPVCKKGCGCKRSPEYWKEHGRDWLVVKK